MQQFLTFITWLFMYSSTCFGRPHAHHQEHNCNSSLWFYRCSMVVAVLLVVVGPIDNQPDHDQQHCYHHTQTVKPEAATAFV
jgi:NADH:ubiquinone oxidoreductase subunit 5 (subunit L)/multisubunit Na+/H+ antiporter MnhA subunit